jgi:hypothetical protein
MSNRESKSVSARGTGRFIAFQISGGLNCVRFRTTQFLSSVLLKFGSMHAVFPLNPHKDSSIRIMLQYKYDDINIKTNSVA